MDKKSDCRWQNKIQKIHLRSGYVVFFEISGYYSDDISGNYRRQELITLAEKVYSNKDLDQPLAPSDTAVKFIEFLENCRKNWGFAKDTFIDCADAATITELRKYKRLHGCLYNFIESYKKVEILDRIKLQLGWIQQDCYLVLETCTEHIAELEKYSWDEEKDIPEDRNDHTINSQQYGWIPYRNMIGFETEDINR